MSGISEERQIFGTDGWDAERWLDEYGKARRSEAMDAEDEIIAKKIMAAGAEIRRQRELIEGLKPLATLGVIAIDTSNEGGGFDGADIYDTAAKVGAILKVAFDPEKHHDAHDVGMEAGDEWAEFPPLVQAARRALEEGE